MVAIITDAFKRQVLDNLYTSVKDSAASYYIAIGRSEDWDSSDTPTIPLNTLKDVRDFRNSMQAMKSGEDVSFVIPRHNWSSGTIYSSYDDAVQGYPSNAYYVLTDENAIYTCLQQGRDANGAIVTSTVKPTGTSILPLTTGDGYVWKYLYTIGALRSTKFTSSNFVPVELIGATDSNSSALEIEQKTIQTGAVPGEITAVKLTSGGTGYTSAPTIIFTGNGNKIPKATATVSGGTVVKIEMDDSGSGKAFGRGYTRASAKLTGGGGTGALARIVMSPALGMGGDPRDDLRSTGLMFNTQIIGNETNSIITGNDFRQIGLIRDPKVGPLSTDSDWEQSSANVLNRLHFGSISANFSEDKAILGSTSAASAVVDKSDSNYVWFHQTELTGFTPFIEGETVTETDGNGEGILDAVGIDGDANAETLPTVNNMSGTLLYIDNRAAIERSDDQTEDVKIIIQL